MTIQRNLGQWVNGDPGREAVRRTIDEIALRLSRMEAMLASVATKAAENGSSGLSAQQKSDVAGLIGALAQSVIGQSTPDPALPGQVGGSNITSLTFTGDTANGLSVSPSTAITAAATVSITFGVTINVATSYKVATVQVVSSRKTGWGAASGTLSRAAYASYAGQTVSAAYVQAEAQATDDAVKLLSRTVAALLTDLILHGLIGP